MAVLLIGVNDEMSKSKPLEIGLPYPIFDKGILKNESDDMVDRQYVSRFELSLASTTFSDIFRYFPVSL